MNRLKGNGKSRENIPDSTFLNVKSRVKHRGDFPIFACRFNPDPLRQNVLAICDETGFVTVYNVERETKTNFCLKRINAHENAVFDLTWLPSNPKRLITVSADRSAILWDVEYGTSVSTFRGHEGSIKCVSAGPEDQNLFVSGGRDGHVMIWDARNRVKFEKGIAPVNKIWNAHYTMVPFNVRTVSKLKPSRSRSVESPNTVSAVLFHNDFSVFSGACKESRIRCWDLRKTYSFLKTNPVPIRKLQYRDDSAVRWPARRAGFTFFATNNYRSSLFASCTDNLIYEYSLTGGNDKPISHFRGAAIRSFYVQTSVSPNLPYLVSGSSDSKAYVWNLNKPESPQFSLNGHGEEVTSVAFNDRMELVTCSDDFSWRYWAYYPCCNDDDGNNASDVVAACRYTDAEC